jgi:TolA-binding protein
MTPSALALRLAAAAALAGLWACSPAPDPAPIPVADTATAPARVVTETVTVRDKDLEQRVSRLELALMDRDAQVEDLQNRLEETRREVVRSMAKVQTLATRAEAASGMAEAEIALQTLRASSRGSGSADVARVSKLLADATNEFNKQNYGGALYLANQAKSTAGIGRTRSSGGESPSLRPGEVTFAVPVELQASARCKLREGPGTTYRVLATLESGATLSGLSHVDQWVRVSTDSGTTGWVFWNLVQRRADTGNK